MLELWGMQSTPSLPSLPGPLWPGVVALDRVLSMSQIELNCVLMLNWIVWNGTFICLKTDLALNNLQRLICHKTQTNKHSWSEWTWELRQSKDNSTLYKSPGLESHNWLSVSLNNNNHNQDGVISSLNGKHLKFVGQFIYLDSNISSTENNVNICRGMAWSTIDWLTTIWKFDLSDKTKQELFQAVAVSVLLYGHIPWTLIICLMKKVGWNNTILWAVMSKSWKQHPTKH